MKPGRGFFWHVYPYFLVVIVLSVGTVTWYTFSLTNRFYLDQTAGQLESRARMVMAACMHGRYTLTAQAIDPFCDKLGQASSTRITFILPSGRVIGDSEKDPQIMDNHADRPEFLAALAHGIGISRRFSATLRQYMMYVAIPLKQGDKVLAVIRTSIPVASIGAAISRVRATIIWGGIAVLIFAAFFSLLISSQLSKPITELEKGANAFSKGHLDKKILVSGPRDLQALGNTMNMMARSLKERIKKVTEQRNQLQAIFSSLVEGVIALDMNEHIVSLNRAACEMLGLDEEKALGSSIQETIRDTELQRIVRKIKDSDMALDEQIDFRARGKRKTLRIRGTLIKNEVSEKTGILIVLYDITRMKKLENIRQEFVANVSHELKTPITAIKASVETLEDMVPDSSDELAGFLKIIKRHSNRLEAIVEDLLTLSRLEQESYHEKAPKQIAKISPILSAAIFACKQRADAKNIYVHLDCAEDLEATVNSRLVEQAVTNLLDNAIKYSDPGKNVVIAAFKASEHLVIKVEDQGHGIAEEHLPRIFERFYRTDKARSRNQGGTGLGLAIVKHVAQVHGGVVTVKSTPGKGSTFFLKLPSH